MADIKKLQAHASKLRAAGMSEPEIRRSVDQLESRLDEEAELAEDESYDPELSQQRRAGLEVERASAGKKALRSENDRPSPRGLSNGQINNLNFERAARGLDPLTGDELMALQLKHANPFNADEGEPAPDIAPRGMHPKKLEAERLRRACSNEPDLLPHPDDRVK